MKSIVKLLIALACTGGFELFASVVQIEEILSWQGDDVAVKKLTEVEIDSIRELPPLEAVSLLISEAGKRPGSKYAKSLVFSAALIEISYIPGNEHRALTLVAEWVENNHKGGVEDKLIKALSPFILDPNERVTILQSLIDEFEVSGELSKFEVYEAALTFGIPDVSAAELLTLKKIGALVDSGQHEAADQLLDDAGSRQWPEECAKYLASIRLLRSLRRDDAPLFQKE